MKLCNCVAEDQDAESMSSSSSDKKKFEELVQLERLVIPNENEDDSNIRTILYGVTGDPNGSPVLFFYPLSGSRRMLLTIHEFAVQYSLKVICVNRPGTEGSSSSTTESTTTNTKCDAVVQKYVERTCLDVVEVLDHLKISKVSILSMCAGTTFALAFCSKFPNRTSGTVLVLAPWTLPADCPHSKALFRFAAHYLPRSMVSSIVGSLAGSMQLSMLNYFSRDTLVKKFLEQLNPKEQELFKHRYNMNPESSSFTSPSSSSKRDFVEELTWVMDGVEPQRLDVSVCLSSSKVLGVDYEIIQQTQTNMAIWQGDKDDLAPTAVTEWFANQIPVSSYKSDGNTDSQDKNKLQSPSPMALNIVPDGTHQGALFLLGSQFMEALQILKQ